MRSFPSQIFISKSIRPSLSKRKMLLLLSSVMMSLLFCDNWNYIMGLTRILH